MSGLSERDVVLLAALLDRHVTDAAFEGGCRLSCGYDGDDLTRHMAEAVLASDWLAERDAAIRAEAKAEALAPIREVHGCYFDLDGEPGYDDTTPEPEDVWRYDRDFRALLDGGDQ